MILIAGMAMVNTPWYMRPASGKSVDVLMGVKGIAYRRKFFNHLKKLENPHPDCFLTDDIWISGLMC